VISHQQEIHAAIPISDFASAGNVGCWQAKRAAPFLILPCPSFMIPQITQNHEKRRSFVTTEYLEQRSRNQTGICPPLPPTRFPGGIMPPLSPCPPLHYALPFIIPSPSLCPPLHYTPLMSLRAKRSNPPYPTIRDCFAPLAMTQRVFSARRPCLRRTLPLKGLRRRMRESLVQKTRKWWIVVRNTRKSSLSVLLSTIFLFFEQEIQAGVATSDLISSSYTLGNTP